MQALPRVTHGKDLCKTRHQSLMGRNYASPNLHKTLIICDWLTISRDYESQRLCLRLNIAYCVWWLRSMNL